MFLFILFVSGLYVLDSWNPLQNGYRKRQYTLLMQSYEHAKEYFDFYNKYKQPLFTGGQKGLSIDYQSFAEKNKENYYIFEKN